jgi:hypothetical protein
LARIEALTARVSALDGDAGEDADQGAAKEQSTLKMEAVKRGFLNQVRGGGGAAGSEERLRTLWVFSVRSNSLKMCILSTCLRSNQGQ